MALDKTDIKILNILQENGRITNAKLAAEIGISPRQCWKESNAWRHPAS
ncbi:Lrp/AsnC family transcriptional regulator [Desulfomarina profundi]